jgi:hypothetical protein
VLFFGYKTTRTGKETIAEFWVLQKSYSQIVSQPVVVTMIA